MMVGLTSNMIFVSVTANDIDVNIASYEWKFTRLPESSELGSIIDNGSTFIFTPDVEGNYILTLTVTDVNGIKEITNQFFQVRNTDDIKPKVVLSGNHFASIGENIDILIENDPGTQKPATIFNWQIVKTPSGSGLRSIFRLY